MNTNNCDDDLELENLRLAALKSMQTKTSKCKPEVQNITNEIERKIDRKVERNFKRTRNNFSTYNKHQPYNQYPSFNQHFTSNRSNLIVLTSESDKPNNKNQLNSNGHFSFNKKKDENFKSYNKNDKLGLKSEDFHKTDSNDKTDSLPTRFRRIEKDSDSDDSDDDIQSNFDENDIEKYRQTYFEFDEENKNKNSSINENDSEENLEDEKKNEVAGIILDAEEESQQDSINSINDKNICVQEEKKGKKILIEQTSKTVSRHEKSEENSTKMNLRSRKNIDNSKERKRIIYDKEEVDNLSKKARNQNKNNNKINLDSSTKNYSEVSLKFSKNDNEKKNRIEILNKSSIVKMISDKTASDKTTKSMRKNKESSMEDNKNYSNRKLLRSLIVKR